jgi:5-(carboxyamino)imidazole ribonucleotide synthase
MHTFSPKIKPLGILGGGQLARMLALKAHSLGIPVTILSENKTDPAAQVVSNHTQARLDDPIALKRFLTSCSVVTFESEFLNANLLTTFAKQTGTEIYPRPRHMAKIQDRLSQKKLLLSLKIPTAKYFQVNTAQSAQRAFDSLGGNIVIKKRRFGYDGNGTYIIRSAKELATFQQNEFLNNPTTGTSYSDSYSDSYSHRFIAEPFIPFKREIAVMIARSRNGITQRLPFVETHQENSRCLWVKGPIAESPALKLLGNSLEEFLNQLKYTGIMGFEIFETDHGYMINELAPRVHNSGHYSLDVLSEDQFTLHLKAVMGLEIANTKDVCYKNSCAKTGFAMWNLIGSHQNSAQWQLKPDIHLHWYGKLENRPGRKMGHFNCLGSSPETALRLAKKNRRLFDL